MTINGLFSYDAGGLYERYTSKPEGVWQSPGASASQAQSILGRVMNDVYYGGRLPSLDELLYMSDGLNPSSSGAQQLVGQVANVFGQRGGFVGQLRAYAFGLINAVRYLNNVALGLFTASQRVAPESSSGVAIQQRIGQISAIEQNLKSQFQLALQFDPTRGRATRV